ncbi:transcription elongation factor GreA [Georgenia satyanarayanai]|uniref:transcription elongation factor GreA n=1 Tax=Georgenia satyanarayanai TaxID=860221 RepID=UPI002041F969|nr:transcription elongation factor GreA [Georgenia satyanarayanai]MCM3662411.1 transcription elongation factor GreA [Georgenia satyanarayanai]
MAETATTWLTAEAYNRLKAELEHLTGPGRAEITERIEAARAEGDLKENGGYHAAREEQGKMEGRIVQLTELLRNAQVGEAPADDGVVESGMVVTAKVAGEQEVFLLGSREAAQDVDVEVLSERSPLGAAIVGKKAGDSVTYTAPNGKDIAVEIVKVKPFTG